MKKGKNLMMGKSAVELMKKLKRERYETIKNVFKEHSSTSSVKNYRRTELVISGQINYFKMCSAEEAEIRIKSVPLKVKGMLLKTLYVCFEKGDFINIAIEINGFDFEVTRVFGYNAYSKLWCIFRDDERIKVTREQKKGTAIREGLLEDILETESGSIAIEFEGTIFEIQPKHFQKVFHYLASEAIVELGIDTVEEKVLFIEAKDPDARVSRFQQDLFLRKLDDVNPTNESLMHYYNSVEHTYSSLIKGKISEVKEERRVA